MVKRSSIKKGTFLETMGWIGVWLILLAYAGNNLGLVENSSLTYQLLNLIGAGIIIYHSVMLKDYQPAVLNIIWAIIAIIAIISSII